VTLVGLGIVDTDLIPTGRFSGVVDRDKILAEAGELRDQLVETFREKVLAAGMPEDRLDLVRAEGSPFREMIRESVFSDLIVMGETCSFPPVNQDYETLKHLYHEASRPILLTHGGDKAAETVVMAMDGTAPSSRMMYNYVHLNPFPQARLVLTYSRREEAGYNLSVYFARVVKYLESFGFSVTENPIDGEMVDDLANVVKSENAQVVALGIQREHFLDRFSDPLGLRQNFAARLLGVMDASLFLVH